MSQRLLPIGAAALFMFLSSLSGCRGGVETHCRSDDDCRSSLRCVVLPSGPPGMCLPKVACPQFEKVPCMELCRLNRGPSRNSESGRNAARHGRDKGSADHDEECVVRCRLIAQWTREWEAEREWK